MLVQNTVGPLNTANFWNCTAVPDRTVELLSQVTVGTFMGLQVDSYAPRASCYMIMGHYILPDQVQAKEGTLVC